MKKFLVILLAVFILTLCVPFTSLIKRDSQDSKTESGKTDREIVTIFQNQ